MTFCMYFTLLREKGRPVFMRMCNLSPARKKGAVLLLVLLVLSLLLLASYRHGDIPATFSILGSNFTTEGTAEYNEEFSVVWFQKEHNPDGGLLTASVRDLSAGTYELEIQYEAQQAPCVLRVADTGTVTPENTLRTVLLEEKLTETESVLFTSFTIESPAANPVFELVVPAGGSVGLSRIAVTPRTPAVQDTWVTMGLVTVCWLVLMWLVLRPAPLCRAGSIAGRPVSGRKISVLLYFGFFAVALLLTSPVLQSALPAGHDDYFHFSRIEGLKNGLLAGQFPVRLHPSTINEHGYLNSLFYPELLLYFPAVLRCLGMSLYGAYQCYVFAIHLLTLVLGYLSFTKLLGSRTAGLVSSVVYAAGLYRLTCVYQRMAVGEYTAMAFIPAILYGLYAVIWGKQRDWPWLVLGVTGVLQAHILSTGIMALLCAMAALIGVRRIFAADKRWLSILKAVVVTVGLNMWFILPFFTMSGQLGLSVFTRGSDVLVQMLTYGADILEFGMDGSVVRGFGIVACITVALTAVALLIMDRRSEDAHTAHLLSLAKVFLAFTCVTLLMSTVLFPWKQLQSIDFINQFISQLQFPFRLLMLPGAGVAILAGILVQLWLREPARRQAAALVFLCALLTLTSTCWLEKISPQPENGVSKLNNPINYKHWASLGRGEYLPTYVKNLSPMWKSDRLLQPSSEDVTVHDVHREQNHFTFSYTCSDPAAENFVTLPLTYYPSYYATVNGQTDYAVPYGDNYNVRVDLTGTEGTVEVYYRVPTVFRLAEAATLATALLCVGWYIWDKKRNTARTLPL